MGEARPGAAARVADAAGLVHDLANVVAVLTASSAMLEDDLAELAPAHPAREQAARVALAAARAGELCERLRPLSAPAPAPRATTNGFDLQVAVSEAAELIAPAIHPATLLCEASETLRVRGAALDAFQVVLNLALNAAEASGDGSVRLRAERWVADRVAPLIGRLVPGRAYARVTVTDDGPGLPDDAATLFAPGMSGSGEEGRGTGLATVAAIVERAGGAIRAGNAPGGGARFEIMWPLDLASPATDALAGASVLIVAGRSGATARVADALEAIGAEPSVCLDPADAVASVAEDRGAWDAVVVAGPVGALSSERIVERLSEADPGLPCVVAAPDASGGEMIAALLAIVGDGR